MRTPSKSKKLLIGEDVEVRQTEEGLRGAWHEGTVIESHSLHRKVKYKHMLDDNCKNDLVETFRVSNAVEGWKNVESDRSRLKKRGYIRPLPPPLNTEVNWTCGLCVDAHYDDAWWEGVLMDNSENSAKRSVFFPDEGDELMIPKENLRVTQDWDETRGNWVVRGHWRLSKLRSFCDSRGFSIKVVWFNVRIHHYFVSKVGEWMHGKKDDWMECLLQVIPLIESEPSRQLIPGVNAPGNQSHLNHEESFISGSWGLRNSNQFQKSNKRNSNQFENSNKSHDSSTGEVSNPGAMVCCETVGQELPLNAVVGKDTPSVHSENANDLIERIGKGFRNGYQLNSKNGSKLSHQSSGRCESLTLPEGGNFLPKLIVRHRSTSTFKPSASLNLEDCGEDCREALLNYNPFSKSSREIIAKAKSYLHHQGWRFELTLRKSGKRQDMQYVSPKGNSYKSLYRACLAWKKEQKFERMIDGHCEDVWAKGSASPSSQEPSVRVKRNMLSSCATFPKRSGRIDTFQQLPRKYSSNDDINGASKINNRSRQLVSSNKRPQGDGNKKKSVICEGPSVSVLTQETQRSNFLSNSVAGHFDLRNMRGEESNSKNFRQAPQPVSGWARKKRKLNLEGSIDVQKQKEAKNSGHVWKTKDTPANWHQIPDLPPTPQRSNDSLSCQDKLTDIFNLSWLIENDVVTENHQVFFMYGKEGWITRHGILCACCYSVHSLTSFEAHAGSKLYQLPVNLRLDDGRTLAQCQMQALRKNMRASSEAKRTRASLMENKRLARLNKKKVTDPVGEHDDFCFVCRQNGEVTLCDSCTRSFHVNCVHPEKIPGTEESSKWFCPNCRCDKCGGGEFSDDENFTESSVLCCEQCECLFHVGCVDDIGIPKLACCPQGTWFCSQKCLEIFSQLRNLVGKVNPVGNEGLSWTLLRSTEEDRDPSCNEIIAEEDSDPLFYKVMAKRKLSSALSVMHECFSRIKEYRTRKDYVEEIIFNRGCDRNVLKFQGFYTAILEKRNKLISVATVRVHGKRVAEIPLISTRTQYRRKGMCRLLLNELEKLLISLQIEKIVLPAIYQLESTWKRSFGFQKMTSKEIFDLLKLDIVHFPDTTMLQKILMGVSPKQEILTEIGDRKNRAELEGMHRSVGNMYGLEIQRGIVPEKPEINACKRRSYSQFEKSVPPLCSLPYKTNTYVKPHSNSGEWGCFNGKMQSLSKGFQHNSSLSKRRCRIHKNEIKKIEFHSGKTPMMRDADESSFVFMCKTRSDRVVKQVKSKIGYSCHWKEKPMPSVEHYLHDRKSYKRRMKDRNIVSDTLPAISPPETLESSQKKDIQFGTSEIRKPDDGSIICRTNSGIADGNCFSNIKAAEPVVDRPVLEHGSDHMAVNRENTSDNSHSVNCYENYRENRCGHLGSLDSFKYVYTRRRKKQCSGNAFSGVIPESTCGTINGSIIQIELQHSLLTRT